MPQEFSTREIVYALIILAVTGFIAWIFYWRLRLILRGLANKTRTSFDNQIIRSIQWPVLACIILAGIYFTVLSLPLFDPLDSALMQGFHIAFLMLAGWAGAMILDGIYRWYKQEIASTTQTPLDDWIVGVLRVVTPLVAAFLVLVYSINFLGIDTTPIITWLEVYGIHIGLILLISVVLILILGRSLPPVVSTIVSQRAPEAMHDEVQKRASTLSKFLVTSGQILIIAIAVLMILREFGIDIVPILTGVGVAGIAIGFGAQTLVKDYFAGIFIVLENQYRIGDVVKVAGITGLVEIIDLRRTVLRDLDGVQHVVCNGEIRVASNFTKEMSRVNLNISVSYGTDLDYAIEVINRVCNEMAADPNWAPLITKTPQVLRVDNLGDSGIDLKILGETKPIRQWDVMGEIRKRIKKTFDAEGIEIPWPHTKVYFGNSPWKTEGKASGITTWHESSEKRPPIEPDKDRSTLLPDSSDDN